MPRRLLPSIVSSGVFRFIVGPKKKEFSLHSDLVAHQSRALDILINGDMNEARERCASWEDVDEQTFIRFSQFIYTGDYTGAEFRARIDRTAQANLKATVIEQPFSPRFISASPRLTPPPPGMVSPQLPSYYRQESGKKALWSRFQGLYPDVNSYTYVYKNKPMDDFSEVFLSHARVYIFADYHDIPTLRAVSLRKLRQKLEHFVLYEEGIEDITQLVQYCYEHTLSRQDSVDELRSLVNIYAACKLEDLFKSEGFRKLVEETGEFAVGVITEALHRLN
jgi:hypothetical protein